MSEDIIKDVEKSFNEFYEDDNSWSEMKSFLSNAYSDDIYKLISVEEIRALLNSPYANKEKIENLMNYLYITNNSIFQLYDTSFSLPTLNHKLDIDFLDTSESVKDMEKNKFILNKTLKKIKHKILTRELLFDVASSGTTVAIWVGSKKNPVLYTFDDLNYVFPARRQDSDWVVWFDLTYFNTLSKNESSSLKQSMSEFITPRMIKNFESGIGKRYIELPPERTSVLNTHTLKRNQALGLPWGTQTVLDIIHKEKLVNLEKSIANKVINSTAVLTLGEGGKDSMYHDAKITNKKKKVVSGVKNALIKNIEGKTPFIAIPHWTKLVFESPSTTGLDPDKFEGVDASINAGTNGIEGIFTGSSSFANSTTTLDIVYRKTGVLLEKIESEVFQKLFNWILPKKYEDEYHLVYDKSTPLTTKEKVTVLEKLNTTFGFSLKAVIDMLDGVNYDNYIQDSIYEQEVLKIQDRIQPYTNAYTSNGETSVVTNTNVDNTEENNTEDEDNTAT